VEPVETFEEPAPRRLIRQRSRVNQEPIAEEPITAPKKKRIIIGQKLETVDAFTEAAPAPIVLPDVTPAFVLEPDEPEEEEDNPIVRRRRRRSSARS
jgi:hypothetical protein